MARPRIIAGNWKMYKTREEAVAFIEALVPRANNAYVAVPFTAIDAAAQVAGESLVIGAQNMNDASEGAFTGEIAAEMLTDVGAKFVLLGHSERRHIFGEQDEFINRKVKRALESSLQPFVCVGETLEQREQGQMEDVLRQQLTASLAGLDAKQAVKVVVAYEPVWAIGTGVTATPDDAQKAHHFLRTLATELWGQEVANAMPIIYGGSVKPDNAAALMAGADVDGVLVGGASLKADSFADIVEAGKA